MNDLGKEIKKKRLALNLRMDDVARQANITRSTLWSIEKGDLKCSAASLFKVMEILGISFSINKVKPVNNNRNRATRINSIHDKKINRFIIMCVEQYAASVNKSSASIYKQMNDTGVIDDLTNDYEDLHGMSLAYLNNYIGTILGENV